MKLFRKLITSFAGSGIPTTEVPSTSIYFTRLLADLISDTKDLHYPIWRIESNVFHVHGKSPTTIVMRYCSPTLRDALLEGRLGRLILFVDDNFWALDRGSGLDRRYRRRLSRYRDTTLAPLLALADPLTVSSDEIARSAKVPSFARVDPAMIRSAARLNHFEAADRRLSVVFPATRSHLVDLEMIAEELAAFLKDHPTAHLTTFLGPHAPGCLRLGNADHRAALSWERYEKVLEEERFHLSVAPAVDSLFNRSRSLTRILDNAYLGAAGLYSDANPFRQVVENGRSGILVPHGRGAWYAALRNAFENPGALAGTAAGGQALAAEVGDPVKWRGFWLALLGIGEAPMRP